MSIDEEGFLSPDIQAWIAKHRAENKDWFKLAEDLSRIGQKILLLLEVPDEKRQLFLISMLFIRGLSQFQGAILLTERGMTTEARTLSRGCFETVFYKGALVEDPEFIDAMLNDDEIRRQKMAKGFLKISKETVNLASLQETLEQFVSTPKEESLKDIKIEGAAKKAGLSEIYDAYYRYLSTDSAHPSVSAIIRHIQTDENGFLVGSKLPWGPDVADVRYTIATACTGMLFLLYFIMKIICEDDKASISAQVDTCWEEFKRLSAEFAEYEPSQGRQG